VVQVVKTTARSPGECSGRLVKIQKMTSKRWVFSGWQNVQFLAEAYKEALMSNFSSRHKPQLQNPGSFQGFDGWGHQAQGGS